MKFHNSEFGYRLRDNFIEFGRLIRVISCIILIFLLVVISYPFHLAAHGFMRKLTDPIIELQSRCANYLISKLFFTLYVG